MKQTLTLLERCQREAREKFGFISDSNFPTNEDINTLIAHTLKQAAEALEGLKEEHTPLHDAHKFYHVKDRNQALTDAQKIITRRG